MFESGYRSMALKLSFGMEAILKLFGVAVIRLRVSLASVIATTTLAQLMKLP